MTDDVWLPLSARLKAALNLGRALAASYVVIYHVAQNRGYDHGPGLLLRFGQEAVIIFFLLSGFLIFAQEARRVEGDLRGYYLRRLRRIYPAALLSLVLAVILAASDGVLGREFSARELLATLLSLQDAGDLKPGVIASPFMHNDPLWSLSYEVAFYLAFPLLMIVWRSSRRGAFGLITAISVVGYATYLAAPNHFSLVAGYLMMWWAGAWFAWAYRAGRYNVPSLLPALAATALMCAVTASGVAFHKTHGIGYFPLLQVRHYVFTLLVLAAVTVRPLARLGASVAARVAAPVAWWASISYGLYVFHYPLLVNWRYSHTAVGFVVALVLLIILSVLGDRWLDQRLPRPCRVEPQSLVRAQR